jgi:7-cyano-7-deazaguanine synthase
MKPAKISKKAIVLLSGGLDSTTCLAIAQSRGFNIYALTIQYGQRHQAELLAAKKIARHYQVQKHLILKIPLTAWGGSSLTDLKLNVAQSRSFQSMAQGIPETYVPARNLIFLSLALAWGETLHVEDFFIGVNVLDYSGYPDCRPAFIHQFEKLARLGTKLGVEQNWKLKIHTPLIHLAKHQIIQEGTRLGVNYAWTHSCYHPRPNHAPCLKCDSCLLRAKGFQLANLEDPLLNRFFRK